MNKTISNTQKKQLKHKKSVIHIFHKKQNFPSFSRLKYGLYGPSWRSPNGKYHIFLSYSSNNQYIYILFLSKFAYSSNKQYIPNSPLFIKFIIINICCCGCTTFLPLFSFPNSKISLIYLFLQYYCCFNFLKSLLLHTMHHFHHSSE